MLTVKFEIYEDGNWLCAAGENNTIFTQAEKWESLLANIDEAVRCHYGIKPGEFKVSLELEPEVLAKLSKGSGSAESSCC
jgi:predicted RNase H-like HicB family nuclease